MGVGRLPLLPYHAPGDSSLGPLPERAARTHHAVLLAIHGPIVAGTCLEQASDTIEELEETARFHLLLRGTHDPSPHPRSGCRARTPIRLTAGRGTRARQPSSR
ncbi:class II aldolase/adducin family protein [Streptomyces zaomyceticus]|uniref:class II aldolase/adducin family protein n=1 Tax=Streptomyces zaomyceticus TaxID=68286 RepID=UPI003419097F